MWVKTQNNAVAAYPYTIEQLRADYPNVSFPRNPTAAVLEEFGVFEFVHADTPAYDPITQRVDTSSAPTLIDGVWTLTKTVVALSAEQVTANQAAAAERLQASIVQATQQRLDDFAKTRNYDGILSCSSYATSTIPAFASEGQRAVALRDQTWTTLLGILNDVTDGLRPVPANFEEIEPELPVLSWT